MAKSFCQDLFQTSNIVPADPQDRQCIICHQETGTMNLETGLIELQVRLPCGHVVGSGCIALWLKDNNSCPMCRRELFSAEALSPAQDGTMWYWDWDWEDRDLEDEEENEERRQMLEETCENYCLQLDLDGRTIEVAQRIIQKLLCSYPFSQAVGVGFDQNAVLLVALGLYIASMLTGHPRSTREICRVRDIHGACIQENYAIDGNRIRLFSNSFFDRREELIDDRIRQYLDDRDVVWPSRDALDESDDQIECSRDLLAVGAHCVNECAHLQVHSPIDDLAQHITANVIRAGFHAFSHPQNSHYLSEPEITAVSIYIAFHLIGQPLSRRTIQDRIGDGCRDILSTCKMVRAKCDPLVEESFWENFDVQLSWESLEAELGKSYDYGRHEYHDEEHTTQGEATSVVAGIVTRPQRISNLCNNYCNRLVLGDNHRTTALALRLSDSFNSSPNFFGRNPESIAAACVFVACASTGHRISYANIEAVTAVSITSIHTTHTMMVHEINLRRVNIEDIAQSLGIDAQNIGNSLQPLDSSMG